MASEDSRYRDRCLRFIVCVMPANRRQSLLVEVDAFQHQVDDRAEGHEVLSLGGDQWIVFEERNDPLSEVLSRFDRVPQKRFSMVVATGALNDPTASEVPSNGFQCRP